MHYTTLNRLHDCNLCTEGWKEILSSLDKTAPDDEPLSLLHILESNGIEDAIWALRAIDDCPEIRLFAVRCVRESCQHLFKNEHSFHALDIAEWYAVGEANKDELKAAWDAAGEEAWDAAGEEAWYAAGEAAGDAAGTAVRYAAWYAAVEAAGTAAGDDAWDDARRAAIQKQTDDFRAIFCSE